VDIKNGLETHGVMMQTTILIVIGMVELVATETLKTGTSIAK
jgi:hypothetical protein